MGPSIPQVGDLNGDGIKDIVTSDYFSNIHFFEGIDNENYKGAVNFKTTNGSDLEIVGAAKNGSGINDGGVYGALAMNDWNEDGLIDILFTARHCPLIVIYNEGEDGNPVFGAIDTIKIGNEIFKDDRPGLLVADLNLDGKKDLIFGRDKIVSYSLNTGTNDTPEFDELSDAMKNNGEAIYMKYGAGAVEASPIHGESQVAMVDWNNDGYPDLLVGENTGWTIGGPLEYMFLFLGVPDGSVNNSISKTIEVVSSEIFNFNYLNNSVIVNENSGRLALVSINGRVIKEITVNSCGQLIEFKGIAKGIYNLVFRGTYRNTVKRITIQ